MKKLLGTTLILIAFAQTTHAQGCSDAGFCSIANLRHAAAEAASAPKQKLSIQLTNGVGDGGVYVFTPGIQYDNQLSKQWAIQAKLTANYANGDLGSVSGLGDLYVSAAYAPTSFGRWKTSFALGAKLPLNNSNQQTNGKAYPLQYQSSLGTVDLIAGFSIANNRWQFATGWQQPLTTRNRNTFLPANWSDAAANEFAPTNRFKRKGDVLLRVGYTIIPTGKFTLGAGLLGIYHLGKDSYTNAANTELRLQGSEGLTLNGTVIASYKASKRFSIGLSGGVPFVVRDIRPDGLTRKFSISPELIFHF
jgi:hypothetical protein